MGGRIVTARTAQGVTPAQLAARLGVLKKTVMNWEADRSAPRGNKLVTLAGLLGVPLVWLTTGEETEGKTFLVDDRKTRSLATKMGQLLSLHQQTSNLILELQEDINHLKNEIDMDENEILEQ